MHNTNAKSILNDIVYMQMIENVIFVMRRFVCSFPLS